MITNEEMYNFASQIAGIKDSDLEIYKCGGKAKKKMEDGGKSPKKKLADDANETAYKGEQEFTPEEVAKRTKENSNNMPQKESWLERFGKNMKKNVEKTVEGAKKKVELLNNKRK